MNIGEYSFGRQLAGGPLGPRWLAHHPQQGEVVLQQLALADPSGQAAVAAAFGTVTSLHVPNLAAAHPPVSDGSHLWLVEEWEESAPLDAIVAEHTLTPQQALGVGRGVLSGLAAAHSVGLVHGTVSPHTVMISLQGVPRLVDVATWLADPRIAAIAPCASPEVVAGASPTAASDVFSAASLIRQLLDGTPVGDELVGVLGRATNPDPSARYADAGTLLHELSAAAERSFGPAWWTVEGLGAAAAGALAAGISGAGAATAAAPASGLGAMPGSLAMMNPAVLGGAAGLESGTGVVAGAKKAGWTPPKLIGLVAGGIVVIGGIVLAANLAAGAGQRHEEVLSAPQAATPSPSVPGAITPTPSPSTALPPQAGFNGTYEYIEKVIKSNDSRTPVGKTYTQTWQVTTDCSTGSCLTSVQTDSGPGDLEVSASGWHSQNDDKVKCVDQVTGVANGQKVGTRYVRDLSAKTTVAGQTIELAGTGRWQQLKKCTKQKIPLIDITYGITLTLKP
ncbi:MAG TPA: hypothetical protein VGK17_14195 [Propionicimonas sp.]